MYWKIHLSIEVRIFFFILLFCVYILFESIYELHLYMSYTIESVSEYYNHSEL